MMKRIFEIEDSARVLVLEDNQHERQDWFRAQLPRAIIVRNPLVAVAALEGRDWDYCFLDFNVPCPENFNGLHVARFLTEIQFSGKVIVHSSNPIGREWMARILHEDGIFATVCEFGCFTISPRR